MQRLFGPMAALGLLALGVPAAQADATKQCGELAFNAGTTLESSNYGAGDITALRTSCPVARLVPRGLEGPGGLAYSSNHFRCKGTATSTEPGARKDWRCMRTVIQGKRPHRREIRQVVTFYSLGAWPALVGAIGRGMECGGFVYRRASPRRSRSTACRRK